jgi:DNA-binding CsgD family transcriptional regulator
VRLEAVRSGMTAYDPRFVDQFDRIHEHLLALAERGGDEAQALRLMLAGIGAWRGEDPAAVSAMVARGLGAGGLIDEDGAELWLAQAMHALVAIDELDQAERLCDDVLARAARRGSVVGVSAGSTYRGYVFAARGDLAQAEADLRGGYELAIEHGLTFAIPSILQFAIDVVPERPGLSDLAALTRTIELPTEFMATASGAMFLEARGRVRLSSGDTATAVEDLRACGTVFDSLHISNPAFSPWRSVLAVALRESDPDAARGLAAAELRNAEIVGLPRARGVALRALGLIEGGDRGIDLLHDAVTELRTSPARLELARALADLGAALRHAGRRSRAREPLSEGLDLARRCGALALSLRAEEELKLAGAKPKRLAFSGRDALTASELRVCRMAAKGMSNPEIAQALFVTRGTVESQLHAAYTKLGIRSRQHLAATLNDPGTS